jgi:hypothetical protein
LSTPARLAESPEWSETAVSAQEDRASGAAAATTPPVNQWGEPWFTRVSAITVWLEVRLEWIYSIAMAVALSQAGTETAVPIPMERPPSWPEPQFASASELIE